MSMMRIKKGDRVIVVSGDDKGKRGEILRVIPKEERVIVQGVNMVTRHTRQTASQEGGRIQKEAPIHVSNVMLVDPKSNEPTRVNIRRDDNGKRIRVAKKSGTDLD